jgi:hypothetical protein
MTRIAAIVGVIVVLVGIVVAILPAWRFTADLGIADAGIVPLSYDDRADEFARRTEHETRDEP